MVVCKLYKKDDIWWISFHDRRGDKLGYDEVLEDWIVKWEECSKYDEFRMREFIEGCIKNERYEFRW